MTRIKKKKKSLNRPLRVLAWVLALVAAVASLSMARTGLSLALELTAALLFAVGAVWPHAFRWLYLPLSRLARSRSRA